MPRSIPAQPNATEATAAPGAPTFMTLHEIGFGGVNNTQHLTGEYFKSRAGIDLVGVNYKGSAAAVTDLLGGQNQAARHHDAPAGAAAA